MGFTVETCGEAGEEDGIHDDARVSHIDEPFPAGLGIEIRLVDIVGEDAAHGDELGRTGRRHGHENEQQ